MAAALNNVRTRWAVPLAMGIAGTRFVLLDLCSSDPPAVPDFTASDAIALLGWIDPLAHVQAQLKLYQLVGNQLWYLVCQCDNATVPVAPTVPPPPGLPSINPPPVVAPTTTQPCAGESPRAYQFHSVSGDGGHFGPRLDLPAGATELECVTTWSPPDSFPATHFPTFDVQFWNAAGGSISSVEFSYYASGIPYTKRISIPTGAVQYQFSASSGSMNVATDLSSVATFYCGSGSTGYPAPAPCAADPSVLAQLDAILQLVTLLQRQVAPFAYVPGARHNGLTGSGQFSVQGLLGVSVILTTVPPGLGNIAGDPPELFDVGFVTLGTADGWHRSVRLEHSPTLIMPILGSETLLGWTLAPGVVVDVLELVREP